jgi:general secretion pathway protein I
MDRQQAQKLAQRGFTLIEVLAAVAVLAIALSALISGMARYADNAARLRDKALAHVVAHNRLTEIELEPGWPSEGRSDGDVEFAAVTWRWEVEIKKTPDEHLRRVDIRVRREQADEDDTLATLSAFIADTGRP